MEQFYKINARYEILNSEGIWEDFEGIVRNIGEKPGLTISTKTRDITSTPDHRFYTHGKERKAEEFCVGDSIDTVDGVERVLSILKRDLPETYDIFCSKSHKVLANGFKVHQCDEFAFLRTDQLARDLWTSVRPTLSTGGSCIITSTPKTDEDQFAEIWKEAINTNDEYGNHTNSRSGSNGFAAIKVPWSAHPDRDDKWADTERKSLGEAKFRQEHECQFVTDDETLINPLVLSRLAGIDPVSFTNTVRWFKDPVPNKAYLVGLDPSLGTGGDSAAIQIWQLPEMEQVAEWQHNKSPPRDQVRILLQTLNVLNQDLQGNPEQRGESEIYWSVENNSIGEAILLVIQDTGEHRFPGTFVSEKQRPGSSKGRRRRKGLTTTSKNKVAACLRFKSLVESKRAKIYSKQLIKQLKAFIARESSFAAKPGGHDDLVMATMLCVRLIDRAIARGTDAGNLLEHISDEDVFNEPMPVVM